jgi:hypothetical protein
VVVVLVSIGGSGRAGYLTWGWALSEAGASIRIEWLRRRGLLPGSGSRAYEGVWCSGLYGSIRMT